MNELFESLHLGTKRNHDVNIVVDGKIIPVMVTSIETERSSYEQRAKIKLEGFINYWFYGNNNAVGISTIPSNMMYEKIIFNKPATIVIWKDGTKTVVKCQKNDVYDPEKGLALCFMKKTLGNQGNFNNILKSALSSE